MFWVKRLSPRYDYASSFMLFFLFSLLFCFVTMIFWCIFAVFAPSIGILWVVVVVVITSCSWAQSSFLVWYHLSMREKKKFYPLVVRVCVCMCEFVWMYFRRSLFLVRFKWKILSKQHWIPMLSLSVLKRYGKNECGNLKRIIEWIYVQQKSQMRYKTYIWASGYLNVHISIFSFSLYRCVFHHVAMFSSTPNSALVAQHFNIFDIYSEYININVNMCVCVLKCMRLHLHHFVLECVHTISSMMHNIAWINEFLSKCREWWKKEKRIKETHTGYK